MEGILGGRIGKVRRTVSYTHSGVLTKWDTEPVRCDAKMGKDEEDGMTWYKAGVGMKLRGSMRTPLTGRPRTNQQGEKGPKAKTDLCYTSEEVQLCLCVPLSSVTLLVRVLTVFVSPKLLSQQ